MYPSKYLDWITGIDGPASVVLSIFRDDVVLNCTVYVWRAECPKFCFPLINNEESLLFHKQCAFEPRHEKTNVLHMRKQRPRSASR